jgi:predicted signal transduction protein with EAL and GGDEF domain
MDQQDLLITPSIGISFYPDDGIESEKLLDHANTAMRRVKETSKGNYLFYNEKFNTHSSLGTIYSLLVVRKKSLKSEC